MSTNSQSIRLKLSIREALGIRLIHNNLSPSDFRCLVEWIENLELYHFPAINNNELLPALAEYIRTRRCNPPKTPRDIHMYWWDCQGVYMCLTLIEQERILKWIQE